MDGVNSFAFTPGITFHTLIVRPPSRPEADVTPTLAFLLAVCGQAPAGFEVRTAAGPKAGELQSIAADGTVKLSGGGTAAAGSWYGLRRAPGALPDWPREPHAELVNGDRVRGTVAAADGDAVRLRLNLPGPEQTVRLPLSALRAVWLTRRPADDPAWLTGPRKRDVLQARNGDLSLGALTAIDPAGNAVRYQADGKDHRLDLSRVSAVGFNTDLARARRPKGPYYRLTLADGTRLSATGVTFDGRTWTATTLFKESVRIPTDQVVSVDVEQGRAVVLSDLKPTKYQYQPFDGEEYSSAADRSVTGDALRLKTAAGESTFDRGLGLHAECTVTYPLAGKYRRFEALVGLDARTGVRGEAVLAVLVDGKERELPGGGRLSLAGGPLPVDLDVSAAKELTVVVRRGNGGVVQDHVNLAEARLILAGD